MALDNGRCQYGCSPIGLVLHPGVDKETDQAVCDYLNSIDSKGGTRAEKLEYANSLSGEVKEYALCWIRYQ